MKYNFIEDLTSDVMFEAYGKDLKEVFQNSAEAMSTVIAQVDRLKEDLEIRMKVEAEDSKELLLNWLQEIIARVDIEEVFFKTFIIEEISETFLKARCLGQKADPALGETVVKAVTYYKLKLEKSDKGWTANVSLDI